MKIALFGATGKAGSHILKSLLEAEHEVTVLVRNAQKLGVSNPNLFLRTGDVLNPEDLSQVLENQDVVVSALSEGLAPVQKTQSRGTANIISAMRTNGVGRIIALGAAGVLQFNETALVNEQSKFPAQFKEVSAEHMDVLHQLQSSGFEWTMVCPTMISNAPLDGRFMVRANYLPAGHDHINAGNLADFIAEELSARIFVNQRVGITNA